ncbi:astacin [Ostertagia ostertagi]
MAAHVDAMPEQRQKLYLLHSTPEERSTERLNERTIYRMQHNMGRSIEEINEKSGATGAYQGDILLTKDELGKVEIRSKRQAMRDLSRRWSNNTVPYIFYHPDEKAKNAFTKAAQLWMTKTCIDFEEHPDPMKTHIKPPRDFLAVAPGDGCFSHVGKNGPGPQVLVLGKGCESVWIENTSFAL